MLSDGSPASRKLPIFAKLRRDESAWQAEPGYGSCRRYACHFYKATVIDSGYNLSMPGIAKPIVFNSAASKSTSLVVSETSGGRTLAHSGSFA